MTGLTTVLWTLLLVQTSSVCWGEAGVETDVPRTKFKAAVFGHALIPPPKTTQPVSRDQALSYLKKNLDVYSNKSAEASKQGADILVFPEDGLYGFDFTRDTIYPYLEYIPDPKLHTWSACDEPDRYPHTDIQHDLSCMAKENNLYIVANMGDKQPCDPKQDPSCPPDGRYQFNTGVAFGPNGTLLAKYHKSHLFYEDQFDTPISKIVFFDTPFGRFGMMTCFDVLFYDPGIPMILNSNISNVVFPTAWMDALPLLSAVGFHSSFARALGVNFLSANIHRPEGRFHGSGVYTPDGMETFYYGTSNESSPQLLVTEIDVLLKPEPNIKIPTKDLFHFPQQPQTVCSDSGQETTNVIDSSPQFHSYLFFDLFTFRTLDAPTGSLKVCQKDVCCELRYAMDENDFGKELYAFGAFDGLHTYEGQYYFQICALIKCADTQNKSTCGAVSHTSMTTFTHVEIDGNMGAYFILPQVVLSNERGELALAEAESWDFKNASLSTNPQFNKRLLSAALYGRYYSRDKCLHLDENNGCQAMQPWLIFYISLSAAMSFLGVVL